MKVFGTCDGQLRRRAVGSPEDAKGRALARPEREGSSGVSPTRFPTPKGLSDAAGALGVASCQVPFSTVYWLQPVQVNFSAASWTGVALPELVATTRLISSVPPLMQNDGVDW